MTISALQKGCPVSDIPASEPQFGAPPTVTQAPARLGTQGTLDLVKKETRAPEAATVNNGADELAIALNNTDLKSPTLLDTLENTISVYGADTFNGIDVITQRLLNMQELELAPESPQTKASKNLAELRAQINSLDYSAIDGTPGKRGLAKRLLGRGKNKMEAFFYQYATVNRNIEGISKKLKKSTDALVMQQAELVKLRERLQEGMRDLNEKVAVLQQFADMVRAAAEETRLEGDEETARIYTEKVLYVTEQRISDLLTKLEIAGQAYLTSDVVSSNGKELIRGIRRAEDTTLWAYKMTAYIARSLGMQEAVLQQLGALKQTTENAITRNAEMLSSQATRIQQMASQPAIDPQVLEQAHGKVLAALDEISSFRQGAVDAFAQSNQMLRELTADSMRRVERTNAEENAITGGGSARAITGN